MSEYDESCDAILHMSYSQVDLLLLLGSPSLLIERTVIGIVIQGHVAEEMGKSDGWVPLLISHDSCDMNDDGDLLCCRCL